MNESIVIKFKNTCRTCLIQKDNLETILHIVDILKECTSIHINMDDDLPKLICWECLNKLNNAFEFRKQCVSSENTLKKMSGVEEMLVKFEDDILFNNQDSLEKRIDNLQTDVDVKSESSYNRNEADFNDAIQSDDSENEPLIKLNRFNNTSNNQSISILNKSYEKLQEEVNDEKSYQLFLNEKKDYIKTFSSLKRDETSSQRLKKKDQVEDAKTKEEINGHESDGANVISEDDLPITARQIKNSKKSLKRKRKSKLTKNDHIIKNDLPCPKCKKSFELESDLEIHMIKHQKFSELICPKCSKSFDDVKNLKKHLNIHMTNKPYNCYICNKSFAEAGSRNRHVRTHTGEKPYVCSTCGKQFSDSSGLSAHMKSHSNIKNFTCIFCSKSFKFPNDLRNHVRIHTGEKPYLCTVCGESFTQAYCVTKHMRKHTGERPYSCTECDRKFRLNEQLKFHMRTHTGYKPHVCKICDIGFARPESLKRHHRSHTGERPYACNACEKKFVLASDLGKHKRVHSKKTK